MPKTLDDIQTLLDSHGYACERKLDVIVATRVPTKVYKSPAGEDFLEIYLTLDKTGDCVAVESLRAFDIKNTEFKQEALSCLLIAAARTPLVRTSLDPADGCVSIRIDCTCGVNGARDTDVLRAIAILPAFVDLWGPEIASAITKGKFDPSKVTNINLSRIFGGSGATPAADCDAAAEAPAAASPKCERQSIGSLMRAAAISTKPGGHANRLKVLAEFRRWLDEHGGGDCERN
jgi:hypothetical protein